MSIATSSSSPNPMDTPSAQRDALRAASRDGWRPPARMSVVAWADTYRQLSKSAGARGGQWRTSDVEVARGPMLAVTEPGVHMISVMVSTQLLKTELLLNVFGYFAHLDPCPMLLLQDKEQAAKDFSDERVAPMVAATPVLRERVGATTTRNRKDKTSRKMFDGGFLALEGAGSSSNVARRPVRVVLADEIDKYPVLRDGYAWLLADERTASYDLTWLSLRTCSPTITDESNIEREYLDSDQRKASIACPHCGHRQFPDFFKHVEWQKRHDAQGKVVEHLWRTARMHCEACGVAWEEGERLSALRSVRWHQTRAFDCCEAHHTPLAAYERAWRGAEAIADAVIVGEDPKPAIAAATQDPVDAVWDWWDDRAEGRYAVYRAKCPTCGRWGVDNLHAGFQAGKLLSPWQKDKPSDIARKWLKAKGDPEAELVFYNTQLGLPHRPSAGRRIEARTLLERCEVYDAEVPDGVALITIGVDTQDYRLELEVVGWGRDEESWSIAYEVIDGELSDPLVQQRLDAFLQRRWRKGNGVTLAAMAACMDSGGHHTNHVYDFCKARLARRVWAIKGASEKDGARNPVWPTKKPQKRAKAAFRPVVIGGNTARDVVRARLAMEETPAPGRALAGYCHFPADRGQGYFDQLLAERVEVKTTAGGRTTRIWINPPGRANEASDCRVYAYAGLCGLKHFGVDVNKLATRAEEQSAAIASGAVAPPPPTAAAEALSPQARRQAIIEKLASRLA
ncbi:MAG: phage terminase large subunit family protein [Dokdonella sp.]|uniref:phage terminase large subunit family protein n=1 Tax=Dokdonella sp. TaxID=2291710 RepID=UPI003F7E5761